MRATKFVAEIITLRAIALKPFGVVSDSFHGFAEIITLRAIALKLFGLLTSKTISGCRDHNATSYSTETEHKSLY